jgi:acetyl esterase
VIVSRENIVGELGDRGSNWGRVFRLAAPPASSLALPASLRKRTTIVHDRVETRFARSHPMRKMTLSVRCASACVLSLCLTASIHAEDLTNIEYGRVGKHSLLLDAHIPDGTGPFPAVILVHGGAWIGGDKISNVEPLFKPLTDAGFAWFSISYRLAADVVRNPLAAALQLGAAESDVRRAVAFVKEHAPEYRVNPNKLVLMGESAGGQLAAMAALRPDPGGAVQGVVAFYTPSDLASLVRTSGMIPDNVRDAVKGSSFDDILMAGLKEFSPINYVSATSPPFLLIHGTDDTIVPVAQSERFCDKLRTAGPGCELYKVEGGGHGIRAWQSSRLTDYKPFMVRWLRQILARD